LDLLRIGNILVRRDLVENGVLRSAGYYENLYKDALKENFEYVENPYGKIGLYRRKDDSRLSLFEVSPSVSYYSGDVGALTVWPLLREKLSTTTFIYDFTNSFTTGRDMKMIMLGERLENEDSSASGSTPPKVVCPDNMLCYGIYNPSKEPAEFDLHFEPAIPVNMLLLNDEVLSGDSTGKLITRISTALKPGINKISVEPVLTTTEYGPDEIKTEPGEHRFIIQRTTDSPVINLDFEYKSAGQVVLTLNYYVQTNSGDENSQPQYAEVNQRQVLLESTGGEWVPIGARITPNRDLAYTEVTLSPYGNKLILTGQAVELQNVTTKEFPRLNVYAENNYEETAGGKIQVEFTKESPTRYELNKDILSSESTKTLVFYQSFDQNWVLLLQNDNKLLELLPLKAAQAVSKLILRKPYYKEVSNEHFIANGYANGWITDGAYNVSDSAEYDLLVVEYKTQRHVYITILLGGLAFIGLTALFYKKPGIFDF
jgi:hypothetical protein